MGLLDVPPSAESKIRLSELVTPPSKKMRSPATTVRLFTLVPLRQGVAELVPLLASLPVGLMKKSAADRLAAQLSRAAAHWFKAGGGFESITAMVISLPGRRGRRRRSSQTQSLGCASCPRWR